MVGLAQISEDVQKRVTFEFMGAWVRGAFTICNGGEPFAYVRLNLVASKFLIRSNIYRQTCALRYELLALTRHTSLEILMRAPEFDLRVV